jgi:hypothetical protein
MIKKLRNQPYAPKVEQAPKWEQEEEKKSILKIVFSLYRVSYLYSKIM